MSLRVPMIIASMVLAGGPDAAPTVEVGGLRLCGPMSGDGWQQQSTEQSQLRRRVSMWGASGQMSAFGHPDLRIVHAIELHFGGSSWGEVVTELRHSAAREGWTVEGSSVGPWSMPAMPTVHAWVQPCKSDEACVVSVVVNDTRCANPFVAALAK